MKNEFRIGQQGWLKVFILMLFLLPGVASFSASPVLQVSSCPIQNLTQTEQSTGSVSYAWNPVSGASAYKVYFVRLSDNFTSSVITTGSTSITLSGLSAGNYHVYIAAVCGQESLDYIIVDVLMM